METMTSRPTFSASAQTRSTVLLVEDEIVVRQITAQVLQSAGYKVLEASGPSEALRVAGTHAEDIHLLLTDVVMPGMNGVELADRMQSLRPDVVTVFMSGYAAADTLKKMRVGSAMHIQKPFTVSSLLSRIAFALQGKAPGDEPTRPASANLP